MSASIASSARDRSWSGRFRPNPWPWATPLWLRSPEPLECRKAMLYLMLLYVYLCIHRPMEIWPALGDMRPELIYFIVLSACWLIAPKRLRSPGLLLAV